MLRDVQDLAFTTNLGLIAAGCAFFGIFAIFPAIAALIAIFGLVADPSVVESQLELLKQVIPAEAYGLFNSQITALLLTRSDTLGWTTAVSILVALWSARSGVAALMTGLNTIMGDRHRAGVYHILAALGLTVALIGVAIVALLTVIVMPILIKFMHLDTATGWLIEVLRWLVSLVVLLVAIGLVYRYGPNRRGRRLPWLTPGSVVVIILWLAASVAFSVYLTNFGSYNEVYGSIGAVIALLMWLYISAYLMLMGAALNVVVLGLR